MPTTTTFDLDALRRGHRQHDPRILVGLYTDDAVLEIVDSTSPPSHPRVFRGRQEIADYLEDICSRDMDHQVRDVVAMDDRIAFTVECEYATGERVLASENCELEDGRIVHEVLIQAWDA